MKKITIVLMKNLLEANVSAFKKDIHANNLKCVDVKEADIINDSDNSVVDIVCLVTLEGKTKDVEKYKKNRGFSRVPNDKRKLYARLED